MMRRLALAVAVALAVEPAGAAEPEGRADTIELAFAGDVMFGRYGDDRFKPIRAESKAVFADVETLLDSDFTMVNLETAVVRRIPKEPPAGKFRFAANPARVATLLDGGIDAVSLANNHAEDMERTGVAEGPQILDELGIRYIGAHRTEAPLVRAETIEVRGWKLAFIAVTVVRNLNQVEGEPELVFSDWFRMRKTVLPVIEEARPAHDLVIVVPHWGDEYDDEPDEWQVKAARQFIDAGADAVIGHHPHVLQGIERYGGGVIAYSLGNFLFDNNADENGQHGVLRLRFRADGRCLARASFHPTYGAKGFVPKRARGARFDAIAERIQTLSDAMGTTWTVEDGALVASPACSP